MRKELQTVLLVLLATLRHHVATTSVPHGPPLDPSPGQTVAASTNAIIEQLKNTNEASRVPTVTDQTEVNPTTGLEAMTKDDGSSPGTTVAFQSEGNPTIVIESKTKEEEVTIYGTTAAFQSETATTTLLEAKIRNEVSSNDATTIAFHSEPNPITVIETKTQDQESTNHQTTAAINNSDVGTQSIAEASVTSDPGENNVRHELSDPSPSSTQESLYENPGDNEVTSQDILPTTFSSVSNGASTTQGPEVSQKASTINRDTIPTVSTPRTISSPVMFQNYPRISSTVGPLPYAQVYSAGLPHPKTEQPVRVASTVRPLVASPLPYVTKAPEVVTPSRSTPQPTTPTSQIQREPIQTVTGIVNPQKEVNSHLAPEKNTSERQPVASSSNVVQQIVKPFDGVKKGGIKIKKKTKKKDNGMGSLIYIPFLIQAKIVPMMLIKLKFLALKAITLGKLALLILGLNLLRNAMLGHDSIDEQYEHETLANQHYGYNGGPEYGAWVNRRLYSPHNFHLSRKNNRQHRPLTYQNIEERSDIVTNTEDSNTFKSYVVSSNSDTVIPLKAENQNNHPYRFYQNIVKESNLPVN